jgi:predicted permease
MLSNFLVCLGAVLPMFILMIIGICVRRGKLLTDGEVKKLNHMVFVVFFPAMMFQNLYGADIASVFSVRLIVFGIACVLGVYFVSMFIVLKVEKSPASRGAMIQAIYRSNFVIMGLPVTMNIYGRGNLAVTALMVAIIVPLYNVLAVITLETFRKGKLNVWHIVKGVITNPLILGAAAGIAAVLLHIKLPGIIESVISDMSGVATPMALIILGASFSFSSLGRVRRDLIICVTGRLVVVPGICLTIAALLGFRGIAFVTLVAMLAAPTAVSSFTMAQDMGSDGELAGNCVIFSSALACFTMFVWLFLFRSLGMF